jgi:Tfp pilus assembly protein PilE
MNSITILSIYILIVLYLLGLSNNITTIIFVGIIVILIILYYKNYKNSIKSNERFEIESGYYDSDNTLRLGKFYSEKNRNTDLDEMVYNTSKKNQKLLNKQLLNEQREPTTDNPFMNPILNDFNTENVPYPVNIDDEVIKEKINLTYNKDLFKDMTDLFDSKNVERQFYTIPGGAIPNDQQKFAEWCYKTPATCKEDTNNCINFDNIKFRNRYK